MVACGGVTERRPGVAPSPLVGEGWGEGAHFDKFSMSQPARQPSLRAVQRAGSFDCPLMSLRAQRGNLVGVLRQVQDERDCQVATLAMTKWVRMRSGATWR